MSFQYGQFDAGFSLSQPTAEALRFKDSVEAMGEDISVIQLTETGEDEYGQPIYSESSWLEKAFIERDGGELTVRPGTVKVGSIRLFMPPWVAVLEDGYEIEVDGVRYHISSLVKNRVYLEIEAERKVK